MDGFWPWLDLITARLGGSRLPWPTTVLPSTFHIDFLTPFGMDLDNFGTHVRPFVYHFTTKFWIIDFVWIFVEFSWKIGTLKSWTI